MINSTIQLLIGSACAVGLDLVGRIIVSASLKTDHRGSSSDSDEKILIVIKLCIVACLSLPCSGGNTIRWWHEIIDTGFVASGGNRPKNPSHAYDRQSYKSVIHVLWGSIIRSHLKLTDWARTEQPVCWWCTRARRRSCGGVVTVRSIVCGCDANWSINGAAGLNLIRKYVVCVHHRRL